MGMIVSRELLPGITEQELMVSRSPWGEAAWAQDLENNLVPEHIPKSHTGR